ncbi:MAG TPA: phosphotransferase [Bryobacteraceae bacterium]|nr:phosphotransferase [Bryobacteraceae bacterium]
MFLLTEDNALPYLEGQGWAGAQQSTIRSLGGGVSNTVLLAEGPAGRIVCKQALEKLRVEADWRSRPERTLREAESMQALAPLLPPGSVPRVLFIDRANCIYAMDAAAPGAEDWKTKLLRGEADPAVASSAGRTLRAILQATWQSTEWNERFGDQTVFDELRLDPYYRYTASRHPDCAAHYERLIDSCRERRVSLVHGDWSPKNMLTGPDGTMVIDFEVVHYGNPCFDTGFLLCHLLMKSIYRPGDAAGYEQCALAFWRALDLDAAHPWLFPETAAHLGGLLLARADGKSPAEYLSPADRDTLRRLAKRIIFDPPTTPETIWKCL